jgi:uncharacterized alkaline shock family protein YloU
MSEENEPIGRIEVAPEVLIMIARFATLDVEGVSKLGNVPAEKGRRFRRLVGDDGISLHVSETTSWHLTSMC